MLRSIQEKLRAGSEKLLGGHPPRRVLAWLTGSAFAVMGVLLLAPGVVSTLRSDVPAAEITAEALPASKVHEPSEASWSDAPGPAPTGPEPAAAALEPAETGSAPTTPLDCIIEPS